MSHTQCILLKISPDAIRWAETHYPQFINPMLGPKKQVTFLLSRALLLNTLQRYYDPNITEIPEFAYNEHRKPIFKSHNISFNITHSSLFVALIMTKGHVPIGIDIEQIQPRKNFAGLLKRSFNQNETQWILNQPNTFSPNTKNHPLTSEEMVRFFLLWSAKEAYLKADGRGFQGLNSLVLNPKKKYMQGDLRNGVMLLTTLPHSSNPQHSSFAIYLPHQLKDNLLIQQLSFNQNQVLFSIFEHPWQLHFFDQDESDKNSFSSSN